MYASVYLSIKKPEVRKRENLFKVLLCVCQYVFVDQETWSEKTRELI